MVYIHYTVLHSICTHCICCIHLSHISTNSAHICAFFIRMKHTMCLTEITHLINMVLCNHAASDKTCMTYPMSTSGGLSRPRRKHIYISGARMLPWFKSAGCPVGVNSIQRKCGGETSLRLRLITAKSTIGSWRCVDFKTASLENSSNGTGSGGSPATTK